MNIAAPRLKESTVRIDGNLIPIGSAETRYTRICNLIGLPSISIPIGFSLSGLPIGMQIAGRPFSEEMVLLVAEAYERNIFRPKQ